MRPLIALLIVVLCVLGCEAAQAEQIVLQNAAPELADTMLPRDDTESSATHRTLPPQHTSSPYSGWKSWCEAEHLPACQTQSDCKDVFHPSGRPLKCIRPWYAAPGSDLRVCSPGFSNRFERDHQRARIRELVRLQYSGEAELCSDGE